VTLLSHSLQATEPSRDNTVQIALLLDTSNSMDGLINQAKSQLWDIVNEFSSAKCGNGTRPNLQIALYQYGNDNLSASEGYVQQVLDFSSDLDEISEKTIFIDHQRWRRILRQSHTNFIATITLEK
ncbi:hypothetical protein Q2T40_02855, partial [Winogradskyella maritima]|nr:hypothetical protein [Winogradskyella maritima]